MSQTIPPQNIPPPMSPRPQPMPPPRPPDDAILESSRLARGQGEQINKIKNGLADGSLTQAEASKLLSQQARISTAFGNVFEDGKVTAQEKMQLLALHAEARKDLFLAQNNSERGKPFLDPALMNKQLDQLGLIAQKVVTGELTGGESASLLETQSGLAQTTSEIEADGAVDWLEQLEVGMKQEDAGYGITSATQNEERALHARPTLPPLPSARG